MRVSNPSKSSAAAQNVIVLDDLEEVMTPPAPKEPMPIKMQLSENKNTEKSDRRNSIQSTVASSITQNRALQRKSQFQKRIPTMLVQADKAIKEEIKEEPKTATTARNKFNPKTFKRQLSGGVPRSKGVVNDVPLDKIQTTGPEK